MTLIGSWFQQSTSGNSATAGTVALTGNNSQSGAAALIYNNCAVAPSSTTNDSGILVLVGVGNFIKVFNNGTVNAIIFPQNGGTINSLAVNAGVAVAPGGNITFTQMSSTTWQTS